MNRILEKDKLFFYFGIRIDIKYKQLIIENGKIIDYLGIIWEKKKIIV